MKVCCKIAIFTVKDIPTFYAIAKARPTKELQLATQDNLLLELEMNSEESFEQTIQVIDIHKHMHSYILLMMIFSIAI